MTLDIRPPRAAFHVFDVECAVTPLGGVTYASKVSRIHPRAQDVSVVEGPLFSVWKTEAPGIGQGTTFVIATGLDAGTWRIVRVHRNDGETMEVVATRA